ncbi:hypothetical protein B0H14DRAFT_3513459 [Mycena olivaceomarginata]|nr:hypothetical protein B0H14DRAFT_3513459 [Mycena olivaceomarginata]
MSMGFLAITFCAGDFPEEAIKIADFAAYTFTTCHPPVWVQNCVFLTMFLASCKILWGNSRHQCLADSKEPELLTSVNADSAAHEQILENAGADCSKDGANIAAPVLYKRVSQCLTAQNIEPEEEEDDAGYGDQD